MLADNKWKNLSKTEYSSGGIVSKVIQKSQAMDITQFNMAEGTEISEHTTTREGFVYVIEGKGIFTLEGENIPMAPGVFIPLGKDMKHSLSAETNTSFILVLNKV